jgi:hypothetical protein
VRLVSLKVSAGNFALAASLVCPPGRRHTAISFVVCRNILIYLDHEVQEQVLNALYYALSGGGYLLLGPSEAADRPQGLFRVIDQNARLYQSTAASAEKAHVSAATAAHARRELDTARAYTQCGDERGRGTSASSRTDGAAQHPRRQIPSGPAPL